MYDLTSSYVEVQYNKAIEKLNHCKKVEILLFYYQGK